MESFPWQNQLQFNLNVPSVSNNLAARYHRPAPVIIDKAGGPLGTRIQQEHVYPSQNVSAGMNFSSLSEDRLTAAVKLAQRDMKKKKEEEFLNNFVKSQKTRSRSPSSRMRKIPGQDVWLRQRRRQPLRDNKPILKVKEHDKNQATRSTRTQTPPRNPGPIDSRVPNSVLPVTTNSPPSRDTDIKVYPVQKSAPCDQPAKEIERLQREMETYLQQIQIIEQRAMQDQSTQFLKPSARSKGKEGYLEREEGNDRKQTRSDELATRAARQLYMLKQQIREVQNDVIRVGPHKVKHTKKSRTYAKLAAAHRGAVRAIQSFVSNLPHTDLSQGLPSTYHELSLLIRQMTLVSNQVATEDKSTVQEDLIKMLDRVDDLNKAWCQDLPEKEETVVTREPVTKSKQRQTSPASRPLFIIEAPQRGRQQAFKHGKENKPKGIIKTSAAGSRGAVRKPKHVKVDTSPERKAALRAGVAALVDAGELKRGMSGMAWETSLNTQPTAAPRSLILPGKLQEKRLRAQQAVMKSIPDCHFADPTVSSNLKAMSPQKNLVLEDRERSFSAPPSPVSAHKREASRSPNRLGKIAWRPGGTPSRNSSSRRRTRSQSPTVTRQFLIQDMVDSDVVKTLFPEEGGERGRSSRRERRISPRRQSRSMSPTDRLVTRAELAIQKRLKPLLDQAEMIASRHENHESAARNVSTRMENIEERGDVLTEMILNDVLKDTENELHRMEQDVSAQRKAVSMQDSPTLENLLQRLEEMELEQFDIRHRWQTLQFAETEPVVRSRVVTKPLAPAAMEITRHTVPPRTMQKNLVCNKDTDPIIFTKLKSEPLWKESRTYQDSDFQGPLSEAAYAIRKPTERLVTLPDRVVQSIHSSVDGYQRYLKKISHHTTGKFDPWRLMEEVADHILTECLQEVTNELEDLNEAIVNQVCKSEFTIPKSVVSSPGQDLSGQSSPGIFPSEPNSPEHINSGPDSPVHIQSALVHRTDSHKMVVFNEQPMQLSISADERERSDEKEESVDDDDEEDDDDDYSYEDDYEEDDEGTKSV